MQALAQKRSVSRPSIARAAPAARARAVVVRADATKPGLAKIADSIGMPTELGFFGFTPFSEMWVGRWAMLGFASTMVGEFTSGGSGTLAQLGLMTPGEPSLPLLVAISALSLGGTLVATASTAAKLAKRDMPRGQLELYKEFLGLNNDKDWQVEEKKMKAKPDFTTPGVDMAAIEAVRAEGMPADRVLSVSGDVAAGEAAAVEMKQVTSSSGRREATPAPANRVDPNSLLMDDMRYARSIELSNGRAAMVGFLAAIVGEALTGYGVLGQLVLWFKATGLLGADSGF